jgi:hypothetical protein
MENSLEAKQPPLFGNFIIPTIRRDIVQQVKITRESIADAKRLHKKFKTKTATEELRIKINELKIERKRIKNDINRLNYCTKKWKIAQNEAEKTFEKLNEANCEINKKHKVKDVHNLKIKKTKNGYSL